MSKIKTGDIINYAYSGAVQSIILPSGQYKLECWGAQGGSYSTAYYGGKGGYSVGILTLESPTKLFIYVGNQGTSVTRSTSGGSGGFNGGGNGGNGQSSSLGIAGSGGGGASDIRIGTDSLYARAIVAGGGGGSGGPGCAGSSSLSASTSQIGGAGGGTSGKAGANSGQASYGGKAGGAGSATQAGTAGAASTSSTTSTDNTYYSGGGGGAGGGWYGGGGGGGGSLQGSSQRGSAGSAGSFGTGGSGGRSYTSGATAYFGSGGGSGGGGSGYVYTSDTASQYPQGCLLNSKYYLQDAQTVDGATSAVSTSGGTQTGQSGSGYVRITAIYVKVGPDVYIKRSDQVQQVEYIESSGTQYIDTGYKPNNTTRVVMDVWPSVAGTYTYFGGRDANTTATFTMWAINQTTVRSDFYTSTSNSLTVDTMLVRSTIDKNRNICTFNGIEITSPDGTFQSNYNLCLLAVNSGGAVDSRMLTAKLYSCQIYDNDVLIRDYVPCLCENGTYGLYDKVNETIVRNSGTGEFMGSSTIVGTFSLPVKWKKAASVWFKIPEKYETVSELQYFTSNGNIYFDTGMKADQNTAIEVGFSTTNEKCALIGSDTAWESSGFGIFCLIAEYGNSSCSSYNKYDGTYHVIKNDRGNVYIDDSLYGTVQSDDFTTLGNLYICANNRSGEAQEIFSGNFYYCKIWSNDILVRNYSACMFSDGTIALYDSVEKGVLYPIGTGSLNSGDISSSFQLTIPSSWKEISSLYIKSSGSWAKSGG